MPNNLSNNRRIAKNTFFLYVRMLLVMAVMLYTSRVVLKALGVVDFGIYNAVGGVVAMLGFLSNSMSNAVQRFLSYEIGRGSTEKISEIFNASLRVHLAIAIIVFVVLEVVGIWVLNAKLTIPIDRLSAANWVFQSAVMSAMFSIMQVPYNSLIIASEEMKAFAYISIVEVMLKLGITLPLFVFSADRLILYSILMAIVSILVVLCYIGYCLTRYKEAKIRRLRNLQSARELLGFAGWNMLGELAWIFTGQGVNLLLNIYFGPVVNAARGLSYQVDAAVNRFVINFQTALNPQIIKTYATNDFKETLSLLYRGTRFSYYLLLILSLPLIFEMKYVLGLWLDEVPDLTVEFCQIILVTSFVTCLSNLFATVAKAYGRIKKYQIVISLVLFLNFPLSLLMLYLGFGPLITVFVALSIQILTLVTRMYLLKEMIVYSAINYLSKVVLPLLIISFLSCIVPTVITFGMEESLSRFLLNMTLTLCTIIFIIYTIGLSDSERTLILRTVKTFLSHFRHYGQ